MFPLLFAIVALFMLGCSVVDRYDKCRIPGQCPIEDSALLCSDGQDNDGDGLIDCFDPGCGAFCQEDTNALCSDGRDNDDDGLVDCGDPSCSATQACCEAGEDRCSDGVDNNLDGAIDCDDEGCCETRVCHNMRLCGVVLLDDDFSSGFAAHGWQTIAPTSGYARDRDVSVQADGAHIVVGTSRYACEEEAGIAWSQPLDLTRGRLSIEADLIVDTPPNTIYYSSAIALTAHVGGPEFFVSPKGDSTQPCPRPDTAGRAPALMLLLWKTGHRNLLWRFDGTGDEGTAEADPATRGLAPPDPSTDRETSRVWHVRMDLDDQQVVLFERVDGAWVEMYRTENRLPHRTFYLSVLSAIDQAREHSVQETILRRIIVRQHVSAHPWRIIYEDSFHADPDWHADKPAMCKWEQSDDAMWLHWESGSDAACYETLAEPWSRQPLKMEFSWYVSTLNWASGIMPGLMDASMYDAVSSFVRVGTGDNDHGEYVAGRICDQRFIHYADHSGDYSQKWLRTSILYDPRSDQMAVDVFDPSTDRQIYYADLDHPVCAASMPYFGITSRGFDRYGPVFSEGLVDDVRIQYGPSDDDVECKDGGVSADGGLPRDGRLSADGGRSADGGIPMDGGR